MKDLSKEELAELKTRWSGIKTRDRLIAMIERRDRAIEALWDGMTDLSYHSSCGACEEGQPIRDAAMAKANDILKEGRDE